MLLQLGNKVFEGLFAPSGWSHSGSEANLAEYELINTKPRLQFTGQTLEEVSLNFKLRLEFCDPAQEIKDIEAWKSSGEVLPFLLGNGDYIGDYVIRSVSKEVTQTLADGTLAEANITVSLVEYVSEDPEEQQAAEDRRNARAVGDKKQVVRRPAQKATSEAEAHAALMEAQNQAWEASEEAERLQEAAKEVEAGGFAELPEESFEKTKTRVQRAQDAMTRAREKIDGVQEKVTSATGVVAAIGQAKDKLTEIGNLMQSPVSLNALNASILNLQTGLRVVNDNSAMFTNNVILRKI